jgi:hypothetical protein
MKTTIKIIVLTITAAFVLSMAFARGQDAKPRTPTEAALNWQLGLRMDDLLACTAQSITLQQQLNADEQKIKELKSDLAEALALR